MKHSRSKVACAYVVPFSRKVSSARREFARFLAEMLARRKDYTRRREKGESFLFFPVRSGKEWREKGMVKREDTRTAPSEISRGNLGISLSSWSSKNPDNFTARTIYGRVSVTVAKPLLPPSLLAPLAQLTFSCAMENVSGRSWLLAVVRVAIEHAHEPRRSVAFCSEIDCTRVYICVCSSLLTSLSLSLSSRAPLRCQRYKFSRAWKFTLRSTFVSFARWLSRGSRGRLCSSCRKINFSRINFYHITFFFNNIYLFIFNFQGYL